MYRILLRIVYYDNTYTICMLIVYYNEYIHYMYFTLSIC